MIPRVNSESQAHLDSMKADPTPSGVMANNTSGHPGNMTSSFTGPAGEMSSNSTNQSNLKNMQSTGNQTNRTNPPQGAGGNDQNADQAIQTPQIVDSLTSSGTTIFVVNISKSLK